jgi:hypothetical protein
MKLTFDSAPNHFGRSVIAEGRLGTLKEMATDPHNPENDTVMVRVEFKQGYSEWFDLMDVYSY